MQGDHLGGERRRELGALGGAGGRGAEGSCADMDLSEAASLSRRVLSLGRGS